MKNRSTVELLVHFILLQFLNSKDVKMTLEEIKESEQPKHVGLIYVLDKYYPNYEKEWENYGSFKLYIKTILEEFLGDMR